MPNDYKAVGLSREPVCAMYSLGLSPVSHIMTKRNKKTQRSTSNPAYLQANHPWAASVLDPFGKAGCHIPDDQTAWSGIIRSYERFVYQPTAFTGTSVSHTGGWIIAPYPYQYRTELIEVVANNGNLTDISTSGNSSNPRFSVPNLSGFTDLSNGKSALVRLTSMGVSVTYRGTELNRAGQITFGLIPSSHPAYSNGTQLSRMTTLYGDTQVSAGNLASALVNTFETRVADAPMKYSWIPSVVPTYQLLSSAGNMLTETGPGPTDPSRLHAASGQAGVQANQYNLVVIIEGDTTPTLASTGNEYLFEVVSHWEVIPEIQNNVAYELTSAPAMPLALAAAMNQFSRNSGHVSYLGNRQGAQAFYAPDSMQVPRNRFSEYFAPAISSGQALVRSSANAAAQMATQAIIARIAAAAAGRGNGRQRLMM